MKKTLLSIALIIGLVSASSIVNAQSGRFSLGAELALPMGDFADVISTGFGASFRYEAPIGDNLGFTGNLGYLTFGGKDTEFLGTTVEGESSFLIPVQVGLKYYFMEQQEGFYGHVLLGVHMYETTEFDVDLTTGVITEETSMESAFSYAPEIGYHLANWDFGLRYQMFSVNTVEYNVLTMEFEDGTSSWGYLGLRAAYVFGGN